MPLCSRDGLDKKSKSKEEYSDIEKVFYCEVTKEIFRDYEEYFQRVMLLNSTIWTCTETGKDNLTYAEALKSERRARKYLREILKGPALIAINEAQQSSINALVQIVNNFLKDRYFRGEQILSSKPGKQTRIPCRVIDIIPPKQVPADGVYDPKTIKYKVENLRKTDVWEATAATARRRRLDLNLTCLKAFITDHTMNGELSIQAKPDAYNKYVTQNNVTFESVYVGKMPKWEPKLFVKGLKQVLIGNYVVKNAENSEKAMLNLKEEMDRIRREKELKKTEDEAKRLEASVKVEDELNRIMRKCDDLERCDQKVMPMYKPVKTLVASKYFGEFLMIQEFLHSFSGILSASDVFRKNITFQQMCRAFLIREVAGPLSDILQVLLSTIFTLQIEENNDCYVSYACSEKKGLMWNMANSAVSAHWYVKKYLAMEMFELPIDAQTLSEILRLHFLGSGAPNGDKSERWRYQYRGGYLSIEDPGLLLRIQHPHILRALKMYTINQLPFKDILKVLTCLIEQILTYNTTLHCIEDRQEALAKVRTDIRTMKARENKRLAKFITTRKTINMEYQAQIAANKDDKKAELDRIAAIKLQDEQDERERKDFEYELAIKEAEYFDYLVLLGTDRAYRRYYVFESLPGLFIEHPSECDDTCLANPPKNDKELAELNNQRVKLRVLLHNRLRNGDKENVKKDDVKTIAESDIVENGQVIKLNGSANPTELTENTREHTPTELYMCSGDPKNCIVHDANNPDRKRWSYINTEGQLNDLLNSLNVLGNRESALRDQLIKLKANIIPHLAKCSETILSVDVTVNQEECMAQMINETRRKYANSNFGFSENADINEVMCTTLTNQIIEFESSITTGCLGSMKIRDIEKWRADITAFEYDSQCKKLPYGTSDTNQSFEDPGKQLGDTLDIESEDSSDEGISVHDSPTLRKNVTNLASALLQIEQSIDRKFLKEPFGVRNEIKDKKEMEKRLEAGKTRLLQWEESLMHSTSYSQVFLHLNILSDAVKWNKSTAQSSCLICKRRGDADKLLLCDECNAGTHMFCMKPVMKKVPEGNWYCFKCELKLGLKQKAKKTHRKMLFSMDDEVEKVESAGASSSSSDDEFIVSKRKKKQAKQTKVTALTNSDDDEQDLSSSDEVPIVQNGVSKKKKKQTKQKKVTASTISDDDQQDLSSSDEVPIVQNGVSKKSAKKSADKGNENGDTDDEPDNIYVDGDVCKDCKTNDTDISCGSCKECYHLDCVGLRRTPRGVWLCASCKTKDDNKRRRPKDKSESDSSSESDESEHKSPPTKRARRSKTTPKDDVSISSDEVSKNNNNTRRVRKTDEFLKLNTIVLYDLLDQIMKHDEAWPFLRPVTQYEVPDYHEIIKNPMDFARIKSNLNMCRYDSTEDVLSDIQLVFKNCDIYNTEGNDIYKAGATLEKFVLEKCKELNLKFSPSDMNLDLAEN